MQLPEVIIIIKRRLRIKILLNFLKTFYTLFIFLIWEDSGLKRWIQLSLPLQPSTCDTPKNKFISFGQITVSETTVTAPIRGHSREAEKLSATGAGRLLECANTEFARARVHTGLCQGGVEVELSAYESVYSESFGCKNKYPWLVKMGGRVQEDQDRDSI